MPLMDRLNSILPSKDHWEQFIIKPQPIIYEISGKNVKQLHLSHLNIRLGRRSIRNCICWSRRSLKIFAPWEDHLSVYSSRINIKWKCKKRPVISRITGQNVQTLQIFASLYCQDVKADCWDRLISYPLYTIKWDMKKGWESVIQIYSHPVAIVYSPLSTHWMSD